MSEGTTEPAGRGEFRFRFHFFARAAGSFWGLAQNADILVSRAQSPALHANAGAGGRVHACRARPRTHPSQNPNADRRVNSAAAEARAGRTRLVRTSRRKY